MATRDLRPGLRVLLACAEASPIVKTGGLGDVCGELPAALAAKGAAVTVLMPAYPEALDRAEGLRVLAPLHDLPGGAGGRLLAGRMPGSGVPLLLLDCPGLFARPGGPYLDPAGAEWPDNHLRFGVLSWVAAALACGEAVPGLGFDVLHAHDWHLGLAPWLLAERARGRTGPGPASVFTIHNLAFQGLFAPEVLGELGLSPAAFTPDGLEFHGRLSFMKAGLLAADRLTTVSPSYAAEILTPEHGCGLDGVLRARADRLTGVLNGAGLAWDPTHGLDLAAPYAADDLAGKVACKQALQQELGLAPDPAAPLLTFGSRLTEQKMADALEAVVPIAVEGGAQLAVLGRGDAEIERRLADLAAAHPGRVSVRLAYSEAAARQALAGADIALTPARFEPCGLVQLYAMRYGTPPVGTPVGGLRDTISTDPEAGTGFLAEAPTAEAFCAELRTALAAFRAQGNGRGEGWRARQQRGMRQESGWSGPAEQYLGDYRRALRRYAVAA